MFTECSLAVDKRYPLHTASLAVHWLFTGCSLAIHWLFTGCSLAVHWLFTGCSLAVHWLFTGCSLAVHWLFTECSLKKPAPHGLRDGSPRHRADAAGQWRHGDGEGQLNVH
jgi:hypothetical protein